MDKQTTLCKINTSMCRFILMALTLLSFPLISSASTVQTVSTLPATCNGGSAQTLTDKVVLVTSGIGQGYTCTKTNTWTADIDSAPPGSQTVVQPLSSGTTTSLNVNNLNSARTSSQFNWILSPSGTISIGANTVTLSVCPDGVDVSNNTNAPYSVYIAGTGTPEAVAVTGGTCAAGASGTIVFTAVNTHSAGFTVQSASAGIQEAVDDAGTNGDIVVPPVPNANPYVVYAPVFLKSKQTLWMYGAVIQCNTRSRCIFAGDLAGGQSYIKILGGRFKAGINVDGAKVTNVVVSANVATITTAAAHSFVTGDIVWVWYKTVSGVGASFRGMATVTGSSDSTHFTFALTTGAVSSTAAFGWTALEDAAIEDNADGSTMRDVNFTSLGSPSLFHFGFVIDNDQKATIDDTSNEGSSDVFRCTANFCGDYVLARGDNSNSPVLYVINSELSLQCGGNGIESYSGNSLHVLDTVVQGFAQFGIHYTQGLQPAILTNVYEEVGGCTNPIYPGSLQSEAGFIDGTLATVNGGGPLQGLEPQFANTGATQRNYYIVPQSTNFGTGPFLLAGYATTNGAGTINVYWPQIPADNNAGTITYDVIFTTGATTVPPYGGSATSLTLATSGSCTNGICTYADTLGAGSAYSYAGQNWAPELWFWPGSVIVTENTNVSTGFGSNTGVIAFTSDQWINSSSSTMVSAYGTVRPSLISSQCATATQSLESPVWIECLAQQMNEGPSTYATVLQQMDPANNGPTNKKGRLNFQFSSNAIPYHSVTWGDANPNKTLATPGHRPGYDANDCYTGFDAGSGGIASAGLSFGCGASISNYIGNVGDGSSWLERLTATLKSFTVPVNSPAYETTTNCSAIGSAANPSVAACGSASAGSLSCATNASAGTCQVNTTAVTTNSEIFLQERTDTVTGTRLGVTCNTGVATVLPVITAVSTGASFTFNLGTVAVNPECWSYFIVNK